eukprot:gene25071-30590_t
MGCYPDDQDIVCKNIKKWGAWENSIGNALMYAEAANNRLSNPFPTKAVLDIGAHVGWFGTLAAARGYKAYMFEPMPTNRAYIRTTMCRNPSFAKNMHLYPYGAGEHGTCRIYSSRTNVGDGHVTCDPNFELPAERYIDRATIELMPIDEVIKEPIFFLKIDTEGFELKAMKTAKRLLRVYGIPWVISEVSHHMMGGKDQVMTYLTFLWDLGYSVHMEHFNGPKIASQNDVEEYMPDEEKGIYDVYCRLLKPELRRRLSDELDG